jgi:hypothetical protein
MPAIDELFAFVADETGKGDEGVIGMTLNMPGIGPAFTPLVGADMKRMESLKPYAIRIGEETGKNIILKKFKLVETREL